MRIRADPDPKHCFKPGMWVRINFFADPDPAVFLNADPDPVLQNCNVTLNLVKKITYEELATIGPYQHRQLGLCFHF